MRHRGFHIWLVLALILSLAATGCGKIAEKASEKVAEKAIENASGGKAKVDLNKQGVEVKTEQGTTKIGASAEWPGTIPADVPKFTGGKIVSVTENTTTDGKYIIVGIESAAADSFDQYKNELEKAGWTIAMTSKSSESLVISASKDDRHVMMNLGSSSEKGLSGGVTYVEPNK